MCSHYTLVTKFNAGTSQKSISVQCQDDSTEDGLTFRQCVRDRVVDSTAGNQQILASDEETEIHDLLAGMGEKEKRKMLKYVVCCEECVLKLLPVCIYMSCIRYRSTSKKSSMVQPKLWTSKLHIVPLKFA